MPKKKVDPAVRHAFKIPIGDWSNDGHGQCEWYYATAAKPIEAVREAFFKAGKLFPKVNPETFCRDYQDGEVPGEVQAELKFWGVPFDPDEFWAREMADIVVWFLNQGDPDLDVRLDPEVAVPMLPFYGFDSKKRHIGHIGYGLFE